MSRLWQFHAIENSGIPITDADLAAQSGPRRSDAIVRAQTAGGKHEVVLCTSVHSDLSASGMIHFAARTRSTNAGVHHGYDGKLQQRTQANTATSTIQDMFETGRGGTWTEY